MVLCHCEGEAEAISFVNIRDDIRDVLFVIPLEGEKCQKLLLPLR